MTCRPGHAPIHPPFAPGNTHAQTHGASSPNVVRPLADAIAAELVATSPWLASPIYTGTVGALAWVEAQCVLVREWLDGQGLLDGDGNPRSAATWLVRLEGRAEQLRARCGLDPMSMVKLLAGLTAVGGEAAADALDELKREGRLLVAGWRELAAPDSEPPAGLDADDDQDQEVTP